MTPRVSVVIPTYERPDAVARSLEALAAQHVSGGFEAIVVDDGSQTRSAVAERRWPFELRQIWQTNLGAAEARNAGARLARGTVIVFADDDVCLRPRALERLVKASAHRQLVVGTVVSAGVPDSPFGRWATAGEPNEEDLNKLAASEPYELPPAHCVTQLLAVHGADFVALGGFQDPTGGWPNWDDVDFGYRAYRAGYRIVRHPGAIGDHYDYALRDLATACDRWRRAARAAPRLFLRHPELASHLPMFRDKRPLAWASDGPRLAARKALRRVSASPPALGVLSALVAALEVRFPLPTLVGPLYRWVVGAHLFIGYREGIAALQRDGACGRMPPANSQGIGHDS